MLTSRTTTNTRTRRVLLGNCSTRARASTARCLHRCCDIYSARSRERRGGDAGGEERGRGRRWEEETRAKLQRFPSRQHVGAWFLVRRAPSRPSEETPVFVIPGGVSVEEAFSTRGPPRWRFGSCFRKMQRKILEVRQSPSRAVGRCHCQRRVVSLPRRRKTSRQLTADRHARTFLSLSLRLLPLLVTVEMFRRGFLPRTMHAVRPLLKPQRLLLTRRASGGILPAPTASQLPGSTSENKRIQGRETVVAPVEWQTRVTAIRAIQRVVDQIRDCALYGN